MIFVFFIAACSEQNEIDVRVLEEYEVKQTFDTVVDDDFILQLNSEQEIYHQGEEVVLFGELIYTGEADEIVINHASSAIVFHLEEQIRSYLISEVLREIGLQTTLEEGVPYREAFSKQDVQVMGTESAPYEAFLEDFKNRDDFPPGYYIVTGTAMFHDGKQPRHIEGTIDFKVLTE